MFIYYYNSGNEKVIVKDYVIVHEVEGYRVVHSQTGQYVTAHENGKHVYMSNKTSSYVLDDTGCLLSSHNTKLYINEHDELWQHNSDNDVFTFRVCTNSKYGLIEIIRWLSERYNFDYHDAILNLKVPNGVAKTNNPYLAMMRNKIQQQTDREEQDNELWNTSLFQQIQNLKCNNVGNVGEYLIKDICDMLSLSYVYEGTRNKNKSNGTFDIIIEKKRVECKTARLGKHGSFQHETIRKEGCDYHIFVDICPNAYYITILPKMTFEQIYSITGRHAHSRKGTNDVFKLDFTEQIFKSMIENGYTVHVNPTTTNTQLECFFTTHFKNSSI